MNNLEEKKGNMGREAQYENEKKKREKGMVGEWSKLVNTDLRKRRISNI